MSDSVWEKQRQILTLFDHVSNPSLQDIKLYCQTFHTTEKDIADHLQKLDTKGAGIAVFPRGVSCSLFDSDNMKEACHVASLLTSQKSFHEFISAATALRTVVNEEMFVFAMMYSVLHRTDTRGCQVPPIEEVLPEWFFPSAILSEANSKTKIATEKASASVEVEYNFTTNELDPETRLSYFREDPQLNSHHWHWHVAYPFTLTPADNVTKDRKGELFYYMHQQVIARYDVERLCNNLPRVRPLINFRVPIAEGYYPNLTMLATGRNYPGRPANMTPADVTEISIDRLQLWKNRILDAIHMGHVTDKSNNRIALVDPLGIDYLGSIMESAGTAINRDYYGNYHNQGHIMFSKMHDPDGRFGGQRSVMAFSAMTMRDPLFYRWHKEVDDIFAEYKNTLAPYDETELAWPDVHVVKATIKTDRTKVQNRIYTYWSKAKALLSRGIDFKTQHPVSAVFQLLQHEDFSYKISVENKMSKPVRSVVRLFLAPTNDEFGKPLNIQQQRTLFMELDKFQTDLRPGLQILIRRSDQSNVTLPTAMGFDQLENPPPGSPPPMTEGFCGCGWPHHLLLPRGREGGMPFDLFVMITNWDTDKVDNLPEKCCGDAASYCGVRDQKYPDRRNMGFPFDRLVPANVSNLKGFLRSNMTATSITISHVDQVVPLGGDFQPPKDACR